MFVFEGLVIFNDFNFSLFKDYFSIKFLFHDINFNFIEEATQNIICDLLLVKNTCIHVHTSRVLLLYNAKVRCVL